MKESRGDGFGLVTHSESNNMPVRRLEFRLLFRA